MIGLPGNSPHSATRCGLREDLIILRAGRRKIEKGIDKDDIIMYPRNEFDNYHYHTH
jgi:hypothetical protein